MARHGAWGALYAGGSVQSLCLRATHRGEWSQCHFSVPLRRPDGSADPQLPGPGEPGTSGWPASLLLSSQQEPGLFLQRTGMQYDDLCPRHGNRTLNGLTDHVDLTGGIRWAELLFANPDCPPPPGFIFALPRAQ